MDRNGIFCGYRRDNKETDIFVRYGGETLGGVQALSENHFNLRHD